MKKIDNDLLVFLKQLSENNNRDWFRSKSNDYDPLKRQFEEFIQEIIDAIAIDDKILKGLEAKSCIYRINRDTRFTHDKSPYKTNFGAFIVRGGRKNGQRYPGYYIHIEPRKSMIAGGAYMPPAPWLKSIREKVADCSEEYLSVIGENSFVKYFSSVDGEKLKTIPKGFPRDHAMAEHLKLKSYIVVHNITDSTVVSPDFQSYVLKVCEAMRRFNEFLVTE